MFKFLAHVMHLDFKPENVMVMMAKNRESRGPLKLIDFGGSIALMKNIVNKNGEDLSFRTTTAFEKVASRDYYAPEQRIMYFYRFLKREDWYVVSSCT